MSESEEENDFQDQEDVLQNVTLGQRVKLQKLGITKFDKSQLEAIKEREYQLQNKAKDSYVFDSISLLI